MASETIKFSYEDKTYDEREFDREFGYYTEYYNHHVYKIVITNETTITEYVFDNSFKLEKNTYTLEELMTIMKNTYRINIYNRSAPDGEDYTRKYEDYYEGKLLSKGSEIMGSDIPSSPIDDGWVKHGICYNYFPNMIRIATYKNGEIDGWNIEKCLITNQIIERLFKLSHSYGYRIKENSIITKNTISLEDLEKYGEPPSISDA